MELKIYTTPTCVWCVKLKEWLKKKKYSYQNCDLTENDLFRDELIKKTGQFAVPVIEVNGHIIVGFQEELLEETIQKAKSSS